MRVNGCFAVAALLLAAAPLTPQQPGQPSVAEAARQARQEQKHARKDVRLYTNDNLPHGSAGLSVAGAETIAPVTAKPPGEKAKSTEGPKKPRGAGGKGPAYWRQRFAETRAKLAQSESELAALEREMGRLQLQYYGDPNKALMQGYTRSDLREQQAKISAKQSEIDRLREELRNLEDELRRSGGEPGWAR